MDSGQWAVGVCSRLAGFGWGRDFFRNLRRDCGVWSRRSGRFLSASGATFCVWAKTFLECTDTWVSFWGNVLIDQCDSGETARYCVFCCYFVVGETNESEAGRERGARDQGSERLAGWRFLLSRPFGQASKSRSLGFARKDGAPTVFWLGRVC